MPVHLYGTPVEIDKICALAKIHGLYVVEDAAQAHGAKVCDRRIGAHGDVVAWSFYPGKNLGALGDGGAITTNNDVLANRIRKLGNYGSSVKYHHQERGANSRLDPIQAAVLSVKLKYLDRWNQRRQKIAGRYAQAFVDLPIILPQVPDQIESVWHLYVIATAQRDAMQAHLTQAGIQSLIHYPIPPHLQPAYTALKVNRLPLAERYANEVLSLPIGPQLEHDQMEAVVKAVRDFPHV
jgi:dTDP-4-amino-4,6-dideoxygalactose transaminase